MEVYTGGSEREVNCTVTTSGSVIELLPKISNTAGIGKASRSYESSCHSQPI